MQLNVEGTRVWGPFIARRLTTHPSRFFPSPLRRVALAGTNYFGASLTAFNILAKYAGYTLVYADQKGVNLFFVRDDLEPASLFADAGDEVKLHRFPGYADCQLC